MNISSVGPNSSNTFEQATVQKTNYRQELSSDTVREKSKSQKNKEAVLSVQAEFLSQVEQGKTPKEAFFDSLKVMEPEYKNQDGDSYCKKEISEKSVANIAKNLTPQNIKPWLELIAFAIPIIKSIMDLLPKSNPPQVPDNQ